MADNTPVYGFRYATSRSDPNPKTIVMVVANLQAFTPDAATAAHCQPGDPIKILPGGTIDLAEPGEAVFGIMVAVGHDGKVFNTSFSTNGVLHPSRHIPSGVNYGTSLERQTLALVVPAAGVIWEIDSDQTLANQGAWQALVGQNADHSFTAPGASDLNATPRLGVGIAAPGSGQWRIEGLSSNGSNQDFSGANVKLLVSVNETQQAPYVTAGV